MRALVYNLTPRRWAICKAAGFISKRAFYGMISPLRLEERPVPSLPGPEWVRLRTILGGVCGTDLALIAQRNHPATILQNFAQFPAVLGHENVAVVDEVGASVPGEWRGRRVCVEPAAGCYARGPTPVCRQCAAGRTSLCEHVRDADLPPRVILGLNSKTGGSWAQYFLAHRSQLHAVPDDIPDDAAILVDPLASAAHAVLRRRPLAGDHVLINGCGIVGLGVALALRALRHDNPITVLARHPFQAELARRIGATAAEVLPRTLSNRDRYAIVARLCGGQAAPCRFGSADLLGGFDLTFDCTGTGVGLSDAIKWTRSRGAVVAVGTSGIAVLDTTSIWFNELHIVGAHGRQVEEVEAGQAHTYDLVLDWLRKGVIGIADLPITRYKLSDYRTALAELLRKNRRCILKAAFEP